MRVKGLAITMGFLMALAIAGAAIGQEAIDSGNGEELAVVLTRLNQIDGMLAYNKLVRNAAEEAFGKLMAERALLAEKVKNLRASSKPPKPDQPTGEDKDE